LRIKEIIIIFILFISLATAQVFPSGWEAWLDTYNVPAGSRGLHDDPDGDGLTNIQEFHVGANPMNPDTDGDGFWDGQEILFYGTNATSSSSYPRAPLNNITLTEPKYSVARMSPFNINITTSNESTLCKFDINPNKRFSEIVLPSQMFAKRDTYTHVIQNYNIPTEGLEITVYVKCNTTTGYINENFPKALTLSFDTTPPAISYFRAEPPEVIESLIVELIVETDDKSVCRFDPAEELDIPIEEYYAYFDRLHNPVFQRVNKLVLTGSGWPRIEDNRDYLYAVTCMNAAGRFSSHATVSFSVNLSAPNRIISTFPSGYITGDRTNISVLTNRNTICHYIENGAYQPFMPPYVRLHTDVKLNLQERNYSYPVSCQFGSGEILETEISFTVDRTKPTNVNITTPAESCDNTTLSASFYATDNNGIAGYSYRILLNNSVLIGYTLTNSSIANLTNLSLPRNERYVWEVYAVDNAGNNGTAIRGSATQILSSEHPLCRQNLLPYLNKSARLTENAFSVYLNCIDIDGTCHADYSIITPTTICTCDTCPTTRYFSPIMITQNVTICYKVTDNLNATVIGNFSARLEACDNTTGCCLGRKGLLCNGNCTVAEVSCTIPEPTPPPQYNTTPTQPTPPPQYNTTPPVYQPPQPHYPEEESNAASIILFFIGIAFTIGGIAMFAEKKPKEFNIKSDLSKPLVDFKQTRKEIQNTPPVQIEAVNPGQSQANAQPLSKVDLEIIKKREHIRLKNMTSIFDEFAAEQSEETPQQTPKAPHKPDVFNRLDDISKEDVFEELEVIRKKDRRRKKESEK
jgi:hypothetical protein